ncbi:PKD domain-containing protein [Hymenobacter edaphi]|uniref:PKD domain-containing protein n=1 Tax=Hymenobacter edaphi TaxID=2211146 RepID=A0A328BBL5_9BACT|nr:PKD domain-containing protein [Hymenobacter edaphi]RAK63246.1 hypothetical protein DLM85_21925 [Hymenobacter edaphi]
MLTSTIVRSLAGAFCMATLALSQPLLAGAGTPPQPVGRPRVVAPVEAGGEFVANRNQWPEKVLYAVDVPMGKLFLGKNQLTHSLFDVHHIEQLQHRHAPAATRVKAHAYTVSFEHANANPVVTSEGKVAMERNYFLGSDPQRWASHVPAYTEVRYQQLYPGTDLRVYSKGASLEYDFELAPKADAGRIRMHYEGVDELRVAADGSLRITTSVGDITEQRPYAYQLRNGQKQEVPCQFQLKGRVVSFALPAGYDHQRPLVIDPVLVYSTYSGSTGNNYGYTATYDSLGNLYSGGIALASGFPVTTGAYDVSYAGTQDMGIMKFNPAATTGAASRLYATYIGGSGTDHPHSMIVDRTGNLVILGSTSNNQFPVTGGVYDNSYNGGTDIVVCKLNSTGSTLLASTYVGGSGSDGQTLAAALNVNYGDEYRGDVQVDNQNNIYFASISSSTNYPTLGGFQTALSGTSDAVVTKLTSSLSALVWSSYLGGTGAESAYSIQVDSVRNVYVSGGTSSSNLPGVAGSFDATYNGGTADGFVASIAASGNVLRRSVFLGTSGYDQAYFVQLDRAGNVYALGQSDGAYPVTSGKYAVNNSRLFIHKMNNGLTTSQFSTRIGAPTTSGVNFSPTAFLVDNCGQILLSAWGGGGQGSGTITGAPVTPDAIQTTAPSGSFYLMQLSADAAGLVYGSYFGNSGPHVDGGTSRFDKRGIIYQAMCVSGGLITTPNAYALTKPTSASYNNAAFKMDILRLQAAFVQSTVINGPRVRRGCAPLTVFFQPASQIGNAARSWNLGDGTVTTQTGVITHTYNTPGRYVVRLTVIDPNACLQNQIATDTVDVFLSPTAAAGADRSICAGTSTTLTAGSAGVAGSTFSWSPAAGLSSTTGASVTATPTATTAYVLTATSPGGCFTRDTVVVRIIPQLQVAYTALSTTGVPQKTGCAPLQLNFRRDTPQAGTSLLWDFGDGTTSAQSGIVSHTFSQPGRYVVRLTVNDAAACPTSRTAVDTVVVNPVPVAAVGPNQTICNGSNTVLRASSTGAPGVVYTWSPAAGLSSTTGANVTAAPTTTTTYTVTATAPTGCASSATVVVNVTPQPRAAFAPTLRQAFTGQLITFNNTTTNATTYAWNFGDAQTSTAATPTHAYEQPGTYQVQLVASSTAQCVDEQRLSIEVRRFELPNVITPNGDRMNDTFKPFVSFAGVDVDIYNRWGTKVFSQTQYTGNWGADAPAGTYYYHLRSSQGEVWKGWVEVIR